MTPVYKGSHLTTTHILNKWCSLILSYSLVTTLHHTSVHIPLRLGGWVGLCGYWLVTMVTSMWVLTMPVRWVAGERVSRHCCEFVVVVVSWSRSVPHSVLQHPAVWPRSGAAATCTHRSYPLYWIIPTCCLFILYSTNTSSDGGQIESVWCHAGSTTLLWQNRPFLNCGCHFVLQV